MSYQKKRKIQVLRTSRTSAGGSPRGFARQVRGEPRLEVPPFDLMIQSNKSTGRDKHAHAEGISP